MNEITMRRALLAATKVTLTLGATFAVVACADGTDSVATQQRDSAPAAGGAAQAATAAPSPAAPPATAGSAAPAPSVAETLPTPPAAPTAPPADPPPAGICRDEACCRAKVSAALTEEDDFVWDPERRAELQAALGDDGLRCCASLVSYQSDGTSAPRIDRHWACCSALEGTDIALDPSTPLACTPWGPPTPPWFADRDDDAVLA